MRNNIATLRLIYVYITTDKSYYIHFITYIFIIEI